MAWRQANWDSRFVRKHPHCEPLISLMHEFRAGYDFSPKFPREFVASTIFRG